MLSKANILILSKLLSKRIFLTLVIERGWKIFAMFLAGPIASMFSPLSIVLISYEFDKAIAISLTILTIFNLVFTGYYSYRYGCIRKDIDSLRC